MLNWIMICKLSNILSKDSHIIIIYLEDPETPTIMTSRFNLNQAAFVVCIGKLGKPQGTTDIYLERRLVEEQEFVSIMDGVESTTEFSSSDCTFLKTMSYQFVTQSSIDNVMFMCRMTSEGGDTYKNSVTVTVEPQRKFFCFLNLLVRYGFFHLV